MIIDMVYSLDSSNSVIKRCGKTHFCLKIKKKIVLLLSIRNII